MIAYETIPADFTVEATALIETIPEFPIPGHCVYNTDGGGREGYSLIVDTEEGVLRGFQHRCSSLTRGTKGTTTAFSITEYEVSLTDCELYEHRPLIEQWRAHRTCPTADFFAAWTLRYEKLVWFVSPCPYYPGAGQLHCRADNRPHEEELCQQDLPTQWIPDMTEVKEWNVRYVEYSAVSI